jgi:DNA primase
VSTANAYREYVERVRHAHTIEDLFARYQHPVTNQQALCFFHADTHPSCSVSNGLYNCFACHSSGDCFTLVMGLDGVTFPQAVDRLAEWAGIPVYRPTAADRDHVLTERQVEDATETAASYYQAKLTPEARAYLHGRGLPDAVIDRARLGWADGHLVASVSHAISGGADALVAAGLARAIRNAPTWTGAPPARDLLERRLVFPALVHGQARFLVGRAFDPGQEPKYLNQKRPQAPIYNQDALNPGEVYVTEGPMDALSLMSWDLPAVALLGTMHHSLVMQLRRPKRLYVCLDADVAGRSGVYRLAAAVGLARVRVITLPEGQDPNDFLRTHTAADFAALQRDALDPISFVLRAISPEPTEPGVLGPQLDRLYRLFQGMSPADVEACLTLQVSQWARGSKGLIRAVRQGWLDFALGERKCPSCGVLLIEHRPL